MPSAGEEPPGVGPAPEPWPDDPRLDPELLAAGDRRNVADRYRYWRMEAIVADRYQHVRHPPTLGAFGAWARGAGLPVLGIDNLPGSVAIDSYALPRECVLLFGQEGPGLSEQARALAQAVLAIRQFGSTRSINAAAASAVAMHEWVRRWAPER